MKNIWLIEWLLYSIRTLPHAHAIMLNKLIVKISCFISKISAASWRIFPPYQLGAKSCSFNSLLTELQSAWMISVSIVGGDSIDVVVIGASFC